MKRLIFTLCIALIISLLHTTEMFVTNTNSRTLSKVNLQTFTVNNAFSQIGLYANHIAYHNAKLFVVNSGDNAIQVIDADTGTTLDTIYLENSSNPWHIKIHAGFGYVTGLFTGKLYRFNLNDFSEVAELYLGVTPQAMLADDELLYVTLTNTQYPVYGQGKVCIVDLNTFSVVNEVNVGTNPQGMIIDSAGKIHVVCTGNYGEIMTSIVIFDSESHEILHTIPAISFYTSIQFGLDGMVYAGNGFGLGFLRYNPETYAVLNDYGTTLFPGGESLLFDDNYTYVLEPGNYYFPSKFHVYDSRMDLVHELALGIGANAMVMRIDEDVSVVDIVKPKGLEIKTYPNPFMSQVKIEVIGDEHEYQVEVFNIKGQKVYESKEKSFTWDGKGMPSGVYMVRVKGEREMGIKKLLLL